MSASSCRCGSHGAPRGARKGARRASRAAPRERLPRSRPARVRGSARPARIPGPHALPPPSCYFGPWRVPPVAACQGGRMVVHFTNRKNAPLLFFHMTGDTTAIALARALQRQPGEDEAMRDNVTSWIPRVARIGLLLLVLGPLAWQFDSH